MWIGCTILFLKEKTSFLHTIKGYNDLTRISPTIGFNVETVEPVEGESFKLFDVGGTEKIRTLWIHHSENSKGIYSVD